VRIEDIRAGRHRVTNLTSITPIEDRVTAIPLRLLDPTLARYFETRMRHYLRAFLHQDRDIMGRQQQGLRFSPPLTLTTTPIPEANWYYGLKREYLRARAEGRPFENPVQPRSLEWRSRGSEARAAPEGAVPILSVSVFFTLGCAVAASSPTRGELRRATPGWQAPGPGRRSP
jgi:hypothetical protein